MGLRGRLRRQAKGWSSCAIAVRREASASLTPAHPARPARRNRAHRDSLPCPANPR